MQQLHNEVIPGESEQQLSTCNQALLNAAPQVLLLPLLAFVSLLSCHTPQVMAFCENLKTLTDDMSFSMALAAGALLDAKNDLSAAANLCTELS